MLFILYFLLCYVVLSCNAYIRCDNPPEKRSFDIQKWPSNTVPYEITNVFTAAQKQLIRDSLNDLTRETGNCVKFVERTSKHPAWVRVINENGCWSKVGKQATSGYQDLSLNTAGCMHKTTVMHEFMHALGFNHEQSRADRDSYVKIINENVQPNQGHNFEKRPSAEITSYGLPYDFMSVMHYVYDGFSTNCRATIEPVQSNSKKWRYTMGTGTDLSSGDIYKIKKFYGCT